MSDDKYKWDRMVVVTALHGERFHGWISEDDGDPDEYLDKCSSEGRAATLINVRNLLGQKEPQKDAMGNFVGLIPLMALMAIDMFPAAMSSYRVVPAAWYFPGKVEGAKKPMKALLDNAENQEMRNRAIAAGIHTAGPVPGGRH